MSGHKDAVRASRADEKGRNERSRDQQGQNKWSRPTSEERARAPLHCTAALGRPSCSGQCSRGSSGWLACAAVARKGQDGQANEQFKRFMPAPQPRLFYTRVYIFETENSTYM